MTCVACLGPTAAAEFGATGEHCDILCLGHLRTLYRARDAKSKLEAAKRAKETCRSCEEPGALYPSGTWCAEHFPPVADSFLVSSSRSNPPRERFEKKQDPELEAREPMLRAVHCPDEKMPGGVRTALKSANDHGFEYHVSLAIDCDGMVSVLARFRHPDGRHLSVRYEQKPEKPMGFTVAWAQNTATALPVRLGYREALQFIKGDLPDSKTDDRAALVAAMELTMTALDADVLEVRMN